MPLVTPSILVAPRALVRGLLACGGLVLLLSAGALAQSICLEQPRFEGSGYGSERVALADLDGDGDLDAVTNAFASQSIWVHTNTGGSFGAHAAFGCGGSPAGMACADLDGDGDVDVAVSNGNGTIAVLANDGLGHFSAPNFCPGASGGGSIVAADFDGDADVDLAVYDGVGDAIRTYVNGGSASFTLFSSFAEDNCSEMAAGDLDGDGDVDLAYVAPLDYRAFVIANNGQGSFAAMASGGSGNSPQGITLADFDNDGDLDFAVSDSWDYDVKVCLNSGNGTSFAYGSYPAGPGPGRIASGDLDLDGDVDLVVVNPFAGVVWALFNLGAGTFVSGPIVGSLGLIGSIALGRLDDDDDLDLVVHGQLLCVVRSCTAASGSYCFGDGIAMPCPCGNESDPGARAGCRHSLGNGATLRATGRASLTIDTLVLRGAAMPDSSVLYFQAGNATAPVPFGDGIKCTAGPFIRLGTKNNASGASAYPTAGDARISVRGLIGSAGTKYYQARYRNAAAFCTALTFNYTNAVAVEWGG